MAEFSIIADISGYLVKLLRENLCPETLQSPESIQLASPSDKNADFQCGLFLYDIKDFGEYRSSAQIRVAGNRRTFPPKPLILHYMLFMNGKAQIAASAEVEQRVLARAEQTIYDNAIISVGAIHPYSDATEDASITFESMSFEEKSKIWTALNIPHQLGVFFSVSPVLLSSRRSEEFVRTTSVRIETGQIEGSSR